MRFQIGTGPVENLVEVKLLSSTELSRRPVGRLSNRDNRPLTHTSNSRYQFVKMR
jgi:hypothetical protein